MAGGVQGRGVCMAGRHAWQGGHAWQGACMAGVCMVGGVCVVGVCMAGGYV